MSCETRHPRNRRGVALWIGVASLAVLALAAWASWDSLVERHHRLLLRHGSEESAYHAAAALTAGGEESLELVRAWALEKALATALPRDVDDPTHFPIHREVTLRAVARALARAGDIHRAEEAICGMDPARQPAELSVLRQLVANRERLDDLAASVARTETAGGSPEIEEAIESLRNACEPRDALRVARAAVTLFEACRENEAREAIARVRELAEGLHGRAARAGKAMALASVASVLWRLGETEDARQLFISAVMTDQEDDEHQVIREQAEVGDLQGAMHSAETLQRDGGSPGGFDPIARVLLRQADIQGARALVDRIVDPALLACIGAELRLHGDPAAAAQMLTEAYARAAELPASIARAGSRARPYSSSRIAHEEARSGAALQALAIAQREAAPHARALMLLGVATGLEERLRELAARRSRTGPPPSPDARP